MIKRLVSHTGFAFFPLALITRLPFAMMVVGVLTLVVSVSGSLILGGLVSALVGIGTAIFGPLIGAAADRFGQRRVLLVTGFLNASFLGLFVWIAWSPLPPSAMLVCALLIGSTAPQTSSMSRSRLIAIVGSKYEPREREKVLSAVMAYESTVDEIVFVFGPFLVGLLAVAFGTGAPVIAAAILTFIFVSVFALHPTARPVTSQEERQATLAPARELLKPALLVTIAGIFGMGLLFGSMLTALTAFMQGLGSEERTGLLYGVMGLGSAILALAVAFFPPSFTRRYRWLVFALIMLAGAIMLQGATNENQLIVALAILGLGVGPILVTQYSLGAARSPVGRNVTVMTTLGSGIILGQASSSAVTGLISEKFGVSAAMLLPLGAVLVVLVTGLLNFWLTPRGKDPSLRRSTI